MKNRFGLVLLLMMGLIGTASAQFGKKLVGNKNYVTITKEVGDFTRLVVWPKVNVYYSVNADSAGFARIHAEENIIHLLDFTQKKGKLDIAFINNMSLDYGYITVTIYSSALAEAAVEGEGVLELQGRIQSPELKLAVGGNGQIIARDLHVPSLKAHITGSGDIYLEGKSNFASYTVNGTGEIRASKLVADEVSCNSNGTGDIGCDAQKELKARLIGTGNVYYLGDPTIKKTIIGNGKLIPGNKSY